MSTLRQGLKDEYQRAFDGQEAKCESARHPVEVKILGAYEYGNVKIVTVETNNTEAQVTRRRNQEERRLLSR